MQIIKYLNTCLSVQIMHAMNYDHISAKQNIGVMWDIWFYITLSIAI